MRKIDKIILHCTATKVTTDYTYKRLEADHLKRGFTDVGYHFYIRKDGNIIPCRPLDKVGAHCVGQNTSSIGICYEGGIGEDGKTPKDTRTDEQKQSMKILVKGCMERFGLKPKDVYGHYMFAAKACPCFDVEKYREEL